MLEIISLSLLTIFTFYYACFISRARIGLYNLHPGKCNSYFPKITVIVAARNEELFIGKCIESLIQQTYPKQCYEIIIVDDGSIDKTAGIVRSYIKDQSNIRLLSLNADGEKKYGSKPCAISKGIELSSGEIILTTDADCFAQPKWIEIMASHFEKDVAFVAGPVTEQTNNSFFTHFEQLELLGLITTAAGLIGSNRPINCNGANMGYRKSAFISAGGFGKNKSTNDDESLMNRIATRKIGNITFAFEAGAVITTHSSNTFISFLKQRIRWANKRGHYEDKTILFSLIAIYLFFLSMTFIVFLIPKKPLLILPFIFAFCIKIFIDYLTLRSGGKLFNQQVPILYFLIAELFHVPYIVIAAAIGQMGSLRWKGRDI